jgi:uncharacterized membrane protein YeaQ/YmgE (transglycosylase-associated protein family)
VLIVLGVVLAVVVLFVLGWVIVGLVLKLLWWALIGLVVGFLARVILPGKQKISILATAGSGIAAAFLGGVVGHVVGFGSILQFVLAVVFAVVIVGALSATEAVRA